MKMQSLPRATLFPLLLLGFAPEALAQPSTVRYSLVDVWFEEDTGTTLQMTGSIDYTYTEGAFESGTAVFHDTYLPWWGTDHLSLDIAAATDLLEITLRGSWHDLGVDVSLYLLPPLSLDQPAVIDPTRSTFEVERGVTHRGTIIRGSLMRECPAPENYGSGSAGSGGFVPAITSSGGDTRIGSSSFQVHCTNLRGGASGFLLAGFGPSQFRALGVDVLVNPVGWFLLPRLAGGAPGVAGAGFVDIPLPIPDEPLAVGLEVDLQLIAFDPGAPGGIASATSGLALRICDH